VKRLMAAVVFLAAPIALFAESGQGLTAGLTLLKPLDARPMGLGRAFTGVNGGMDSLNSNPGGLGTLKDPALSATYVSGIVDDNFGSFAYAHPVAIGSLFASLSYFDGGKIDITPTGGPTETKRAEQDEVGLVGLALGKTSPFSLGLAAKFYRFNLAEAASASGLAADAGVIWRTPIEGFSLGGALQNMGSDLKYEVESEPIPQTARAGAAYELNFENLSAFRRLPFRALLAADAIKVKNEDAGIAAGLELTTDTDLMDYVGTASLRGGYNSSGNVFSAGVGFRIGDLALDYALNVLHDSMGQVHRVTLGWRFLPAKEKH
jgi:hypothetical protein